MGAETLRRKAWKDYDLDMTFDEVVLLRDAWFDTYPAIKPYQQEQYSHRFDAVWSVAGRPRRACWMPDTEDGAVVHLLLQLQCASIRFRSAARRNGAGGPGTARHLDRIGAR